MEEEKLRRPPPTASTGNSGTSPPPSVPPPPVRRPRRLLFLTRLPTRRDPQVQTEGAHAVLRRPSRGDQQACESQSPGLRSQRSDDGEHRKGQNNPPSLPMGPAEIPPPLSHSIPSAVPPPRRSSTVARRLSSSSTRPRTFAPRPVSPRFCDIVISMI